MSFDNIKVEKLNLFLLALLTFFALIFAILVPFLGFLGWAVLPIPTVLLFISSRKRDAIICACLGIIALVFFDYLLAVFIAIMIIGIALLYNYSIEKKLEAEKVILLILSVFIAVIAFYILFVSVINRVNFISEFINNYNNFINNLGSDPLIKNYANIFGGSDFEQVLDQTKDILRFFPYIFPGLGLAYLLIISIANYIGSFKILKKFGFNLKRLPEFGKWDLSWHFSWGIILGIIIILIPTFLQVNNTVFYALGGNLLIIFGFIYLVLGVSVIWGLFEKYKVAMPLRVIIFIILGLFFGFAIIIPIIGLLDVWINFRRLKRI